jgi:hypothetical protein
MKDIIIQMIVASLAALLGAFLGAYSAYHYMRKVEDEKIKRRREAAGTIIQAELAHFYRELQDHEGKLAGYLSRVTNTVGGTTKADYPKLKVGESFSTVYKATIPEIGLFDTETSYGIVYCYSNIFTLMRNQDTFISEIDGLLNSSMLAHRAKSLFDQEVALFQQIERIMPRLAQQSRAIPFSPAARSIKL